MRSGTLVLSVMAVLLVAVRLSPPANAQENLPWREPVKISAAVHVGTLSYPVELWWSSVDGGWHGAIPPGQVSVLAGAGTAEWAVGLLSWSDSRLGSWVGGRFAAPADVVVIIPTATDSGAFWWPHRTIMLLVMGFFTGTAGLILFGLFGALARNMRLGLEALGR